MHLTQDCLLCASESRDILCPDCAAELPALPERRCPICALPTRGGEICGHCLAKPPFFDETLAAFRYDFPLDKMIQSFKYGHRLSIGTYLGRHLAVLARDQRADLLIPLPLHPSRLSQRGFNQALEIARPIAAALKLPIAKTLCQRGRDTAPQADLSVQERHGNLRSAFQCTADLSGKRILLVDDVMTTGASAHECARTLKQHGAERVTVMVVARALPR